MTIQDQLDEMDKLEKDKVKLARQIGILESKLQSSANEVQGITEVPRRPSRR